MWKSKKATTSIYVQVKRYAETYFVLCDEDDTVETLKGRILVQLNQCGITRLERAEEDITKDDIKLWLKKRVSAIDSAITVAI